VAALLALGVTAAPRLAHAVGAEIGANGGPAVRTSSEIGKTYGVFLGIRPVGSVPFYFDVFYSHQEFDLTKRTPEGGHRYPDIDVIGGRFRYLLDASKRLKPYGHLGLGYAHISYPGVLGPQSEDISNGRPRSVFLRTGGFAELPLGLGLAIEVAKSLRVNIEGTFRPGFAFGGAAYKDSEIPAEKKVSMGGSLTGGVSFYF
jgi:hypothetical protein